MRKHAKGEHVSSLLGILCDCFSFCHTVMVISMLGHIAAPNFQTPVAMLSVTVVYYDAFFSFGAV